MRRLQKKTRILIAPIIGLVSLVTLGLSITISEIKNSTIFSGSVVLASTIFSMPNASNNFITMLNNGQTLQVDKNIYEENQQHLNTVVEDDINKDNIIESDENKTIVSNNEQSTDNEQTIIQDFAKTPVGAGKGIVLTEQYSKGSSLSAIQFGSGFIKNVTGLSASEVLAYASEEPEFNILKNGLPQVLIYHTHTTESYLDEDSGQYDLSFSGRTEKLEKNMVRVGEEIAKQLEEIGITVIHEKTIHDYSYNGSYGRSAETVKNILNKYPSIEIALDIHRDAIVKDDSSIVKPTSTIDGKKAAQVMIISGCDNGNMNMPNWPHNLRFAVRLQDRMESMFPGLTRPILFDYRSYNQNLTNGSVLIEVGSHANTLDEAIYSGELVGKALASYLDEISSEEE